MAVSWKPTKPKDPPDVDPDQASTPSWKSAKVRIKRK